MTSTTWKRPGFIVAAVVIVLALLAGLTLLLWPRHTTPTGQGTAPGSTSTPASTSSGTAGSVCGLAAGTQGIPSAGPDATWTSRNKFLTPASRTAGPARTTPDGLHRCYAHSATGAILAAANFESDALAAMANGAVPALEPWYVPGPGHDAGRAALATASPTPVAPGIFQVAGFTVTSIGPGDQLPDQVAVDLVVSEDSRYGAFALTMQWYQGDWRVVVLPDGSIATHAAAAGNFTPWSGI